MPLGRRTLPLAMVWRTSSSDTPYCSSCCGCSSTRTAGSELPPTDFADAGHLRQLLRRDGGADVVQLGLPSTSDVSESTMIGAWDGLILR